jgi:hypothetical protein
MNVSYAISNVKEAILNVKEGILNVLEQWGLSRDGELLKKYPQKPNY